MLLEIVSSYRVILSLGRSGADHDTLRVVASRRDRAGGINPTGAVCKTDP